MTGRDALARARACVGCKVRLHGRSPALALDCVGLAAEATGLSVRSLPPADYCLRADNRERLRAELRRQGFRHVGIDTEAVGDLVEFVVAPGAHHLAVLAGATIIHADFSVRRVVEVSIPPDWQVAAYWRREDKG